MKKATGCQSSAFRLFLGNFRLLRFALWLTPAYAGGRTGEGIRELAILVSFLAILIRPAETLGAWPDGPETNVPICTAQGTQEHPRIVTDGAAGAIIVWQDIASSSEGASPLKRPLPSSDIYAQRVDARGIVRWTKNGVAICLEKGDQWFPDLLYDSAGGAVIVWWDKRSGDMDIYAQRINGDGEVQWKPGGVPICTAPRPQQDLNIATDGEGGAIIAWHDYRAESGAPDIYAQRINSKGDVQWELDGIIVSKQVSYQSYPTLASDGEGGVIIAWHDWRDGKGDIYAQRVNASGQMLWHENGIPVCKAQEHQWYPTATPDGEGGAVFVWMDCRGGAGWDVYAQRVDAQGKMQWHIDGVPICIAEGDQYNYSIVGAGTGGAFITWCDQRSGNWDIYVQKLDASGNIKWTKDGLPVCTEPNDQHNPSMCSDGADGVIITWWDKRDIYADIYAQRIDAGGNFLWVEGGAAICTAEGSQQDSQPVNSGVGSAIITWWDMRKVDADIYAQRVFSE